MKSQLSKIKSALRKGADLSKVKVYQRFFKTGPGQYGAGDLFLGVTVPKQRLVAKQFADLSLSDLQSLLASKFHEDRCTSLIILVNQFNRADKAGKIKLAKFYLKNLRYVNNWDLVDGSAPKILGPYLEILCQRPSQLQNSPTSHPEMIRSIAENRRRIPAHLQPTPEILRLRLSTSAAQNDILTRLALSRNIWQRRTAMLATFYSIQKNQPQETLRLAKILLNDSEDLIHKAVGWMLREVGKHCGQALLEKFLRQHKNQMPRTMLRYAIERLPVNKKKLYLS